MKGCPLEISSEQERTRLALIAYEAHLDAHMARHDHLGTAA